MKLADVATQVGEHIVERIAEPPIITFPFIHIVVDDLLPGGFFDQLRQRWPSDLNSVGDGNHRHKWPKGDGFWPVLDAALCGLGGAIGTRFGVDVPDRITTSIVTNVAPFEMRPHIDNKAISAVIYFDGRGGTVFMVPKPHRYRDPGATMPWDDFEVGARPDLVPNRLVAWTGFSESWHGVPSVWPGEQRRLIHVFYG